MPLSGHSRTAGRSASRQCTLRVWGFLIRRAELHPASRRHLIWKLALEKSLQPFGTYAIGQSRRMTISSNLVGGIIFKGIIDYSGPSSVELSHYLIIGPVC